MLGIEEHVKVSYFHCKYTENINIMQIYIIIFISFCTFQNDVNHNIKFSKMVKFIDKPNQEIK